MRQFFFALVATVTSMLSAPGFSLPRESRQCIVGVARDWNDSHVVVHLFERFGHQAWQAVAGPWPGRLGSRGLVWGRGLHPLPRGAALKVEGDRRAPAGVFDIGGAWGYERELQRHPALFYRQVGPRDLWVEDPNSPYYNQHLVLEHEPRMPWERKAQMKQNDYPHSLKLFIAHNAPPRAVAGAGSAIFFHIWRQGGKRATAGCTTLSEPHLRQLIAWVDPTQRPIYVLLPRAEYQRLEPLWKLPPLPAPQ